MFTEVKEAAQGHTTSKDWPVPLFHNSQSPPSASYLAGTVPSSLHYTCEVSVSAIHKTGNTESKGGEEPVPELG